ncbi:hypothetical protein DL93DRAFT_2098724 [Clavulina sp. PMI_390]|nr:hypothetical protein DL93DRAFT_2098724 [Clavulina sp. PMI_390]
MAPVTRARSTPGTRVNTRTYEPMSSSSSKNMRGKTAASVPSANSLDTEPSSPNRSSRSRTTSTTQKTPKRVNFKAVISSIIPSKPRVGSPTPEEVKRAIANAHWEPDLASEETPLTTGNPDWDPSMVNQEAMEDTFDPHAYDWYQPAPLDPQDPFFDQICAEMEDMHPNLDAQAFMQQRWNEYVADPSPYLNQRYS